MTRSRSKNIVPLEKRMFAPLGRFPLIKMFKWLFDVWFWNVLHQNVIILFIFSHWLEICRSNLLDTIGLSGGSSPHTRQSQQHTSPSYGHQCSSQELWGEEYERQCFKFIFVPLDRLVTTDGCDPVTAVPRYLWASLSMSSRYQKSVRSSWTLHSICTSGTSIVNCAEIKMQNHQQYIL